MWPRDVPSPWFPLAPGPAPCSAPAGCGSSVSARAWRGDRGWLARVLPTVGAAGTAPMAFWGGFALSPCSLPGEGPSRAVQLDLSAGPPMMLPKPGLRAQPGQRSFHRDFGGMGQPPAALRCFPILLRVQTSPSPVPSRKTVMCCRHGLAHVFSRPSCEEREDSPTLEKKRIGSSIQMDKVRER